MNELGRPHPAPSAGAPLATPHIFYQRGFGNTANDLVLVTGVLRHQSLI